MNFKRIDSNIVYAIALGKRGHFKAMYELLKQVSPNEKALFYAENGQFNDAVRELEFETEKRFSLIEAMRVRAGLELDKKVIETYQSYHDLKRGAASRGGFLFKANSPAVRPVTRALYSTGTSGANLAGTINRADLMNFKENRSLVELLGCTIVDDLEAGNKYQIPIETTEIPVYDILEGGGAPTVEDPEWQDVVSAAPYILFTMLNYSRRFMLQMSEDVEAMLKARNDFAIMNGISYRMLYGDTTSNQCEGLVNKTGFTPIAGASFDESKAYNLIKLVNAAGAPRINRYFVLNAALEETLKKRPYTSGGDRRLIEKGLLCDEPYIVNENVSNGHLWYGEWSDIVVMLYPREILFDPYNASDTGGMLLKQWQGYDVHPRNLSWFRLAENVD